MKKTKIVATLGPKSWNREVIKKLMLEGVNVFRHNMSHQTYDKGEEVTDIIRSLSKELNLTVGVLVDTKGPEIRTGKFEDGKAVFEIDSVVRIFPNEILGNNKRFSTSYANLVNDVEIGDYLIIGDNQIEFKIIDKEDSILVTEVKSGGVLGDKKGVNVPNVHLNFPFLSQKDIDDINWACKIDADYLALSFVRNANDVLKVNDILIENKNDHIAIISKIEDIQAVEDLDNIISVSDGIMVARGDLGVNLPMEQVPYLQKRMIEKARSMNKVSIVATEMLASMENNAHPTRAEVNDVFNAVLDLTDAVMLSGETANGLYPVRAVQTMAKIVESAESTIKYRDQLANIKRTNTEDITTAISYSSVDSAIRINASSIVCPTLSGYTARRISYFRPNCPIIAVSSNDKTLRALSLNYGVYTKAVSKLYENDELYKDLVIIAKDKFKLEKDSKLILTGSHPVDTNNTTNFMKIDEVF